MRALILRPAFSPRQLPCHLQAGNATVGFNVGTDWAAIKPQAPFGQLPLLTVPAATAWASSPYARSGDEACTHIGQTAAIINYIGKTAGTEGDTAEAFATSQQLLAEGEDLYGLAVKYLPTLYKRLSDPAAGITTSKGSAADYASFWATLLPSHLTRINRLCRGGSFQPPARSATQYLPGELYLWNVLYQFHMIDPSVSVDFRSAPAAPVWNTLGRLRVGLRVFPSARLQERVGGARPSPSPLPALRRCSLRTRTSASGSSASATSRRLSASPVERARWAN